METLHVNGPPQLGDSLVSLREPGLRGVSVDLAMQSLRAGYGDSWPEVDLTDDDGRAWQLGELVLGEMASLDIPEALSLSGEEAPEVHGFIEMNDGFSRELQRMLARTGLGAEITSPHSSQLMRLVQFFADNRRPAPDSFMYENFTMAHGPTIITPNPEKILSAVHAAGQPAAKIGEIIDRAVILVHSQGTEQRGSVISRPVIIPR